MSPNGMELYPKKRELEQIGVQVSISKEAQATQVQRGEGGRIQFIKEDKARLIQIENNLLVVNQLRPYSRFEDWYSFPESPGTPAEMLDIYDIFTLPQPSEDVISQAIELLEIGQTPSGAGDQLLNHSSRERQEYLHRLRKEWEK